MASKTYTLNVDVNAPSVAQLESQLEQVNQELKDLDRNSDAFKSAAKDAQLLNKELEKINGEVEGLTLDKKIMAADGAAKVFGGSLSAAVGTLGVLGVESEVFGEFEEKAASAIAVGLGVKDVVEGFGQLTKVVKLQTIAQKALNVVTTVYNAIMAANPVALVVLSITALIGLVVTLKDKFEALNKVFMFFKGLVDSVAEAIGLAETAEEKAARVFKENAEQRVKDIENELKVRKAAGADTVALEREKLEKLIALTEEGTQERKDAEADLAAFEADLAKKKEDDAKAQAEKEEAARKERYEKRKAEEQKRLDEEKKNAEEAANFYERLKQGELDLLAKTDQQKLDLDYQRTLAEIEALKVSEEEKNKIRLQAEENYQLQKADLEAQKAQEEKDKLEANQQELADIMEFYRLESIENVFERAREELRIEEEKELARLEAIGATEEQIAQVKKFYADKQKQIVGEQTEWEKMNAQAKAAFLVDAAAQTFGNLATILGEESKAGKAAAIAETIIRTYQSAQSAYASLAVIPVVGPALGAVAAAAAVAAGIANVNKIKSTKLPGGDVSGPSISASSIPTPPQAPANTPPVDEIQEFGAEQTAPTIKAYVVSGDTTSAQEADAKITKKRDVTG